MNIVARILKLIVTAFVLAVMYSMPLAAQTAELDQLFEDLAAADEQNWQSIEQNIWSEWSKSGSPSMDLLLDRGRRAMQEGDLPTAIDHFTALTDHAPNFAEGWNARATAYFQAGLFGPSIEDIRRVLVLNPRHFGALSGLAVILTDIGYPKDALEIYQEVLAIHPHRPNLKEAIERLKTEIGGSDI